jgi:hypothetical protein
MAPVPINATLNAMRHPCAMRGFIALAIMCVLGASTCGRTAAASPAGEKTDPCAGAVRYHMPEGVETGAPEKGVAPAELPGTSPNLTVPDTVSFPLHFQVLTDPKFHDTNIDLGRVALDRPSGAVTLDGIALSDPSDADLQARCNDGRATTKSALPPPSANSATQNQSQH